MSAGARARASAVVADDASQIDQAYRSLSAAHPAFAAARWEPFASGYDNILLRLQHAALGDLVVRVPRRAFAVAALPGEVGVLQALAGRLPIATPQPLYVTARALAYPYLPGRVLGHTNPTTWSPTNLGASLGATLRALHDLPARDVWPAAPPGDTLGRLALEDQRAQLPGRFRRLQVRSIVGDPAPWLEPWRDPPTVPGERPRVVVHGDLHAGQLLVDDAGVPSALVDWTDAHFGDPALDIAGVMTLVDRDAWSTFEASYGPVDAVTRRLAWYRAVHHTACLANLAESSGDGVLLSSAVRSLERLATG